MSGFLWFFIHKFTHGKEGGGLCGERNNRLGYDSFMAEPVVPLSAIDL